MKIIPVQSVSTLFLRLIAATLCGVLALAGTAGRSWALVTEPNSTPYTPATGALCYFGSSGVAVAKRWVLTAKHVGYGSLVYLDGVPYPVVEHHVPGNSLDLMLLKIGSDLPRWNSITRTNPVGGEAVTMAGCGRFRGQPIINGLGWDSVPGNGTVVHGQNRIAVSCNATDCGQVFATSFSRPDGAIGDAPLPHEAAAQMNDSGGPVFMHGTNGRLEVIGVLTGASSAYSAYYGGTSSGINLRSSQAMSFFNNVDPTILQGYNRVDMDQDGRVTPDDIFVFLNFFFTQDLRAEFDGNGFLQVTDIFIFLDAYFAS